MAEQKRGRIVDLSGSTSAVLDRLQAVTSRIDAHPAPAPRRGPETVGAGAAGPAAPGSAAADGAPDDTTVRSNRATSATQPGTATVGDQRADDPDGDVSVDQVLDALVLLRHLRAELESWEPRLIAAARHRGASWAELAPALGVASRQAAERRYLRLCPIDDEPSRQTRDGRVRAERDRRAGDRAVARWAQDNGANLRQLAGQIAALTDLAPAAQPSLERLHDALGWPDPTGLVRLLAEAQQHLRAEHSALAAQIDTVVAQVAEVRQRTREHRSARRLAREPGINPSDPPNSSRST